MKKFDTEAIHTELRLMPGWSFVNGFLEKHFVFVNFKETITAMVRIGFEAEHMNHHPDWSNVYNKLHVKLRTHDADGITEKDFTLAKKIDVIANSMIKQ